jgi:hypothetical protein
MCVTGENGWFRLTTFITSKCCGGLFIHPDKPGEYLNWSHEYPTDGIGDMLDWDMYRLNFYLGSSINAPSFIPFSRESTSTPGCQDVEEITNAMVQSRTRFYKQTVQGRVYLKWIGHSLQEERSLSTEALELNPRYAIIRTNKTDEQMYVVLSFEIYSNHVLHRKQEDPTTDEFNRNFPVRKLERFSTVHYVAKSGSQYNTTNSRGKIEIDVYLFKTRHMEFILVPGGEAMDVVSMAVYRYDQEVMNQLRENCPTEFGDAVHNPNVISFGFSGEHFQNNRGYQFGIDLCEDGFWVFWVSHPKTSNIHKPYGVLRKEHNMELYIYKQVASEDSVPFLLGFFNKTLQEMKQDNPEFVKVGSEQYDSFLQYFNGIMEVAEIQPEEQYIEVYAKDVENIIRHHKKLVGGNFVKNGEQVVLGGNITGDSFQLFTNAKCMLGRARPLKSGKQVKIEIGGDDKFFRSAFKGVSSRC